jgi:heat shock protein HslJ
LTVVSAVGLAVVVCGIALSQAITDEPTPEPQAVSQSQLRNSSKDAAATADGTGWAVRRLGDVNAPSSNPPDAIVHFLPDGKVVGTLNCNGIGGSATWTADGRFEGMSAPLISTLIGCEETASGSHAFAEEFWRKMHNAERWQLTEGGLLIFFSDGSTAHLERLLVSATEEIFPSATGSGSND